MGATTYTKSWSEGAWGINGWSGIAPAYSIDAGIEGTASVGSIALRIDSNVFPTGVHAAVFDGGFYVLVDDIVIPDSFPLYGEGFVGTVGFSLSKQVLLSGVDATGFVSGNVTFSISTQTTPIGVEGIGAVSNVAIEVDDNVYLDGVQASATVGNAIAYPIATPLGTLGVGLLGVPEVGWVVQTVSATASIGTVVPKVTAVEDFGWGALGWGQVPWGYGASNGLTATGYIGSTIPTIAVTSIGVSSTGQIGITTPRIIKTLAGVEGVGQIGAFTFGGWNVINDYQTPGWVVINDMQEPIAA